MKKHISLFLLIILSSLFIYLRYQTIINAESHQVISAYGYGLRDYTTIQYHAKHDTSYTFLEGMAYPYGDHVVIASAIPLLSNGLKFLKSIGIDWTGDAMPILHYSMLVSILFCSIFLYLIFRELNVPVFYSIIVSISISFLSPQTDWITGGHFGLAYTFVIPLIIYLLILFDRKSNWIRSIFLLFTVVLTSQLHFFYFAISGLFIGSFYLFSILLSSNLKGKSLWNRLLFYIIHYSIQVLLPFSFFKWWFGQVNIIDRVDNPYGYWESVASLEGIFTSLRSPVWQWFNGSFFSLETTSIEESAYVGIIPMIFVIIMLGYWLCYFFRYSFFKLFSQNALIIQKLFYASFLLLLFSFGFPFALPFLDSLRDYSGIFKQINIVGRFSWVFFYVINIIAFTFIYQQVNKLFYHKWASEFAIVLFAVILEFTIFESSQFSLSQKVRLDGIPEWKEGQSFVDKTKLDFTQYQAILPIPFYHVGTDNLYPITEGFIQQKSSVASVETGLPVMAALMSKSSQSHAYQLFQLVSEPYKLPKVLNDIQDNRPLLMMVDTFFQKKASHLIKKATLKYSENRLAIYELPISAFQKNVQEKYHKVKTEIDSSQLYSIGEFLSTDSVKNFYYEAFDREKGMPYHGNGGLKLYLKSEYTLYNDKIEGAKDNNIYLLSFWCNILKYPTANTFVRIKELDFNTKEIVGEKMQQVRYHISAMDNKGWALCEIPFKLKSRDGIVQISLSQPPRQISDFYLDELLIRNEKTDLYKNFNGGVFKNGRWYEFK